MNLKAIQRYEEGKKGILNMYTYEQMLHNAKKFLLDYNHFLIVSHVQPDGDAISSMVTVAWLLSSLGKKGVMITEAEIPERFHFLDGAKYIVSAKEKPLNDTYSYVICVDCSDRDRVGRLSEWFADDAHVLNIDHHVTNNFFGEVNVVKADAAATAEIMYDLVEQCQVDWTLASATAVYGGLLTDTGGFRYQNTTSRTMKIASCLLDQGVDGAYTAKILLEKMTFSQLQLLIQTLSRIQTTDDGKIAWTTITNVDLEKCSATVDETKQIVNYLCNLDDVQIAILFKQQMNGTKISFRSAGQPNVAALAKQFSGGGHVAAAGCYIAEPLTEHLIAHVVEEASRPW